MSTTAATELPRAAHPPRPVRWPGWYRYLRTELAPLPNRGGKTLRLVVVNVIVTLLSMSLRIPGLGVSAYVATILTKDNQASTTKTCIGIVIGVFTACVTSLLVYRVSLDYPQARLAYMLVMVFVGMFLLRASTVGFVGWAAAFFSSLIQGNADSGHTADQVVRGTLWFGMYFFYPVLVVLVINRIFLPARPREELVNGLRQRLDLAIEILQTLAREGNVGGRDDLAARASASRGVTAGLGTLVQTEADHPEIKARHDTLTSAVVAAAWVARATGRLAARPPAPLTEHDRRCVEMTLAECERLRAQASNLDADPAEAEITGFPEAADLPELAELQSAVTALRVSLNITEPPEAEAAPPKKGFFKPDAFTNADYSHYALKTTLATAVSYILYNAVDWPGLSTALFTCTVITFEGHNEGTVHKGLLRIGGCCAGGLLGFLAVTFLFPYMTSVGSLCLLSAAVTALGGWIASGSENTAYFGGQLMYAFYVSTDQKFAPTIEYSDIRNRFMGIMLGLVVSSWVYSNLWPQRAADRVRPTLAKALGDLARLILLPASNPDPDTRWSETISLRRALPATLASALHQAELSEDETDPATPAARRAPPTALPDLVAQAQAMFLTASVLATRRGEKVRQSLPPPVQSAELRLRQSIADNLHASADWLTARPAAQPSDLAAALRDWREQATGIAPDAHVRLLERLAVRAQQW